jgi:hypothetical protein
LETDQNYLILFEELIIFKSLLIDFIDKNIKIKETKKYINVGSVIDFSKDLSSNKLNKPKISVKNRTLKKLI